MELIITVGSGGYDKTLSFWHCFSGWNKEQLFVPGCAQKARAIQSPSLHPTILPGEWLMVALPGQSYPKFHFFSISHSQKGPEQFQTYRCAGFYQRYLHSGTAFSVFCGSLDWGNQTLQALTTFFSPFTFFPLNCAVDIELSDEIAMKLTNLMFRHKLDINHDMKMEHKVLLSPRSKHKLYKVSIKIWSQNCVTASINMWVWISLPQRLPKLC